MLENYKSFFNFGPSYFLYPVLLVRMSFRSVFACAIDANGKVCKQGILIDHGDDGG
jgi:hypothetical protein